jgi:hypothetical protein
MTISSGSKEVYEGLLQDLIDLCETRLRGTDAPDCMEQIQLKATRAAAYQDILVWESQLAASKSTP